MYSGIDVKTYRVGPSFKYDILVKPQVDPGIIHLKYNGVHTVLNASGDLVMNLGFKTIQESAPYTYQLIDGKKVEVSSRYVLNAQGDLGFAFPDGYNKNCELIIDPTFVCNL